MWWTKANKIIWSVCFDRFFSFLRAETFLVAHDQLSVTLSLWHV